MRTRLLLPLGALALVAACSTASTSGPAPSAAPAPAAGRAAADRDVVRTASVKMAVEQPDTAAARVGRITERVGGHVESATLVDNARVRMVVFVPSDSLDPVLTEMAALGRMEDRRITLLDVTDEAAEMAARLQNLIAVRDRLRQQIGRTATAQEALELERELNRVEREIDTLEAQLRAMRREAALARVDLNLHRRRILGPVGLVFSGVGWVISKLFVIQ